MNTVVKFFKSEPAGGIVLIFSALLALLFANSTSLAPLYEVFTQPALFWINDVLMVVFFFVVGLEIKREFVEGNLKERQQALLPIIAAIGGVIAPALIYVGINLDNPETLRGWAVPSATDIAFALGIIALLGTRVPLSLKVFLTAIAIIDDLIAILIIALFYTGGIDWHMLSLAPFVIFALYVLNKSHTTSMFPYLVWGGLLWMALYNSGLHPTLAGVIVSLFIPLQPKEGISFSKKLESMLHPWVTFAILPLFGFANAGVSLEGITLNDFLHPLTLGIMAGLFFGKQIGIFLTTVLIVRLGFSKIPKGATWAQVYGVALLCGIGFTMSLFIGTLAFETSEELKHLRLGVLSGSLISALCGYLFLLCVKPEPKIVKQSVNKTKITKKSKKSIKKVISKKNKTQSKRKVERK